MDALTSAQVQTEHIVESINGRVSKCKSSQYAIDVHKVGCAIWDEVEDLTEMYRVWLLVDLCIEALSTIPSRQVCSPTCKSPVIITIILPGAALEGCTSFVEIMCLTFWNGNP